MELILLFVAQVRKLPSTWVGKAPLIGQRIHFNDEGKTEKFTRMLDRPFQSSDDAILVILQCDEHPTANEEIVERSAEHPLSNAKEFKVCYINNQKLGNSCRSLLLTSFSMLRVFETSKMIHWWLQVCEFLSLPVKSSNNKMNRETSSECEIVVKMRKKMHFSVFTAVFCLL